MLNKIIKHIRQRTIGKVLKIRINGLRIKFFKKILMRISPFVFYRLVAHNVDDYRDNEETILMGKIPERYMRLVSLIPGSRVLEIGAGEGVLSLLLAREKEKVFAVDISPFRNKKALELQSIWREKGFNVNRCEMVLGNIKDHLDLLKEIDTVVAVSCIYYFRDDIYNIFKTIARHATYVVLAGNAHRGQEYFKFGNRSLDIGKYNYYASLEGMKLILKQNGYKIIKEMDKGNQPVVVGFKKQSK
jgi:SAM-dependent methyltransferase